MRAIRELRAPYLAVASSRGPTEDQPGRFNGMVPEVGLALHLVPRGWHRLHAAQQATKASAVAAT